METTFTPAVGDRVIASGIPGYEHVEPLEAVITHIYEDGRFYRYLGDMEVPTYGKVNLSFAAADPIPTEGVSMETTTTYDGPLYSTDAPDFESRFRLVEGKYEINIGSGMASNGDNPWWVEVNGDVYLHLKEVRSLDHLFQYAIKLAGSDKRTYNATVRASANARRAIETISRLLLQEAENRGWCAEYDEFVDSVNSAIADTGFELEERTQEFEVEYEVEFDGYSFGSGSVMVTAKTQGDAEEMVSENPEDFDIDFEEIALDYIRSNSYLFRISI